MKNAFAIVKGAVAILSIFTAHTVIGYTTPYPFYQCNIILVFLTWLLLRGYKTRAIWSGFVLGYLTELFSADYFGVRLVAILVTIIGVTWLLEKIFTNQAWYTITILGFIVSTGHRLLFIGFSVASQGFRNLGLYLTWPIVQSVLVEAVINTVGLVLIYLITNFIWVRTSPRYV